MIWNAVRTAYWQKRLSKSLLSLNRSICVFRSVLLCDANPANPFEPPTTAPPSHFIRASGTI